MIDSASQRVDFRRFSRTDPIAHPVPVELVPLPWSIRMKVALGAAKGLAFLHEAEQPVIFRDFKTSNILLDEVSRRPLLLHLLMNIHPFIHSAIHPAEG